MTSTSQRANGTFDIFIEELKSDDELLQAFLRDPGRTLDLAADWGVPLSTTELHELQRPGFRLWDRVTEALESCFSLAA